MSDNKIGLSQSNSVQGNFPWIYCIISQAVLDGSMWWNRFSRTKSHNRNTKCKEFCSYDMVIGQAAPLRLRLRFGLGKFWRSLLSLLFFSRYINQQWLMSGLDLIFEKVMMNVCLNSLESLHRLPEHLGEPEQEENYQNYGPCHLIELFQESIILNLLY